MNKLGKTSKHGDQPIASTESAPQKIIERGSVVTLKDPPGNESTYVVLGFHNKHYNKWFLMMEQNEKQALASEQRKAKLSLQTRHVELNDGPAMH